MQSLMMAYLDLTRNWFSCIYSPKLRSNLDILARCQPKSILFMHKEINRTFSSMPENEKVTC